MAKTPSSDAASRADTDSPQSKLKRLPDYLLAGLPKCSSLDAVSAHTCFPCALFREKVSVELQRRAKSARNRNEIGQGDESRPL